MHDADSIKTALRETALGLGFSALGVAAPDTALAELPRLNSWLAAGYSAELSYMYRQPQARCDARSLLPGCASVIAVALPVARLEVAEAATTCSHSGKVARYAQGEDYHHAVDCRLKQLASRLDELAPGNQHKISVDTSPILEKAYAVAAGIGWRGKHTLVLNAEHGSSFMLGLLLTTAQILPDTPSAGSCGSCRRCIEACPTSALLDPGVLDARLCISYWTTAAKSAAPEGFDFHGWGYGCDACQDACPYNRHVTQTHPV